MSRHFLEAYINKTQGPRFRVICEDPKSCRRQEGNRKGCVYREAFLTDSRTLNMDGWPDMEYVLGYIELRRPALTPTPDLVSSPVNKEIRHGDETVPPAQ